MTTSVLGYIIESFLIGVKIMTANRRLLLTRMSNWSDIIELDDGESLDDFETTFASEQSSIAIDLMCAIRDGYSTDAILDAECHRWKLQFPQLIISTQPIRRRITPRRRRRQQQREMIRDGIVRELLETHLWPHVTFER
jgi:hypothetical protein